jgi:uncharacterized protein with GYD domain
LPKFLVQASYTVEGTKGLLQGGASQRRQAVEELMASLGGKLETFYFTFGDEDAVLIIDLPSQEAALSVAIAIRATGMVRSKITPLISLDEADRAIKQHVKYRPPGA